MATKINNFTIGVIGGMGSFATVDFFKRLVEAFPAEKEWERPRIIVDNYCTMPSRVRAILYEENIDQLVIMLSASVTNLIAAGVDRIVLACNTSHVFLPKIIERVPKAAEKILNVVNNCCEKIAENTSVNTIGLVASEGTIQTGFYSDAFAKYGIFTVVPDEKQYYSLRGFIEAIKQNDVSKDVMREFVDFVNKFSCDDVLLGCTELPILYRLCTENGFIFSKRIYDPLQFAIDELVKEYRRCEKC